jgi:hypothetical protein
MNRHTSRPFRRLVSAAAIAALFCSEKNTQNTDAASGNQTQRPKQNRNDFARAAETDLRMSAATCVTASPASVLASNDVALATSSVSSLSLTAIELAAKLLADRLFVQDVVPRKQRRYALELLVEPLCVFDRQTDNAKRNVEINTKVKHEQHTMRANRIERRQKRLFLAKFYIIREVLRRATSR